VVDEILECEATREIRRVLRSITSRSAADTRALPVHFAQKLQLLNVRSVERSPRVSFQRTTRELQVRKRIHDDVEDARRTARE